MQKKIPIYFIVAFFIVSLITVFVIAYRSIHYPSKEPIKVATHPVLVVDFDFDEKLNQEELLNSQDAILAVRQPQKDKPNQVFNSVNALERLDLNKDGRLDKRDPIFPYLELVFLTQHGKNHKYIPIKDLGITAISFNKELLAKLKDTPIDSNTIIGRAIKSNGKELQIRVISVTVD